LCCLRQMVHFCKCLHGVELQPLTYHRPQALLVMFQMHLTKTKTLLLQFSKYLLGTSDILILQAYPRDITKYRDEILQSVGIIIDWTRI
jgi:hypothetical protein